MAQVNWLQIAANAWNVLVDHAERKHKLTYSELASQLGIHHRNTRLPLEHIQQYCLQAGLPNLTVLVVSKSTQQPGSGFAGASAEVMRRTAMEVGAWPWAKEDNPFWFALDGTTAHQLIEDLTTGGEAALRVGQRVSDRGPLQALFREALLEVYQGRCAFSGSSVAEALDAAHIIPWSQATDEERVDVRNGVLLSAYHHRLYDRGILVLHEDWSVGIGDGVALAALSDFDRTAIEAAVGPRMRCKPTRFEDFPRKDLIRRRNESLP